MFGNTIRKTHESTGSAVSASRIKLFKGFALHHLSS
jgi:hypothetical protein